MKYSIVLAGLLAILFIGGKARAQQGLMFSPSLMYYSYDDRDNGGNLAQVTGQYLDLRLGYVMPYNLYFGGLYSMMDRKDGTTDRKRTSYGPSIGVVYNGFELIGTYIFSSQYVEDSGTTLQKGSGIQIDLGYFFNV